MADYGTIVLTGANRGIGLEYARRLAPRAERLVACCRSPGEAGELKELADANPSLEPRALDVTDHEAIAGLATDLKGQPVDLLINNAGVSGPRPDPGVSDVEAWRQVFEVNTIAPAKMVEALLDSVAASRRKLVANITSKMGSIGDNGSGGAIVYRSSKAALNATMRSMALDSADRGVTVLLLHPGWVRTDMGGPNGLIDVDTSVSGMLAIIDRAGPDDSGQFFDYDGSQIPW